MRQPWHTTVEVQFHWTTWYKPTSTNGPALWGGLDAAGPPGYIFCSNKRCCSLCYVAIWTLSKVHYCAVSVTCCPPAAVYIRGVRAGLQYGGNS